MNILKRSRIALVLRGFAKTEAQVAKNVEQILAATAAAAALEIKGRLIFSKICIAVPSDARFTDCDCGKTAGALRDALKHEFDTRISVAEVAKGDLFCGLLNHVTAKLVRERHDYVAVASHGATKYLTEENMSAMLEAIEAGAKVTGIAIEELQESILDGRIANTLAIWDAMALLSNGGFDPRASQAKKDDRQVAYLRGFDNSHGEIFYPISGVEEIIPLCRLVDAYGKCIAPILPHETAKWIAPDPSSDPGGYARHIKKLGTKFVRQEAMALSIGCDLSFLKSGVMEAYRNQI